MRSPPDGGSGPRGGRRLVITADDFGASVEVNAAVEAASRRGVLTAASLMVGGAAAADAIARARRQPGLAVGLHLVLVEGRPVSAPADVPDLVGPDGGFRQDLVRLGVDILARPSVRRQAAGEIRAQFAAFAATGLRLDHVNGHRHYHLHPTIADLIAVIGRDFGLRAIRAPCEPRAVLAAAEAAGPRPGSLLSAAWAARARRRWRELGFITPDRVFGERWSGAMSAARLAGLIAHLPAGLTEIYLHPATDDGHRAAAPGYRHREEFEALIDPRVIAAVRLPGLAVGGYGDFVAPRAAAA